MPTTTLEERVKLLEEALNSIQRHLRIDIVSSPRVKDMYPVSRFLHNDGYYGIQNGDYIAIFKEYSDGTTEPAFHINLIGADGVYPAYSLHSDNTCEYTHVRPIILTTEDTKKLGIPIRTGKMVHKT